MATKRRSRRSSRRSRAGDAQARSKRGRFTGKPTPAPNVGMNPFGPEAQVRLESRWNTGDRGAVYEFNIKIRRRVETSASEAEWEQDAQTALEEFEYELKKKYPWLGSFYRTGRSAGWLAIEDPKGKMTKAIAGDIARRVEAAKRQFVKDMETAWPPSGRRSR